MNQRLLNRGRAVDPRVVKYIDSIFIKSKLMDVDVDVFF